MQKFTVVFTAKVEASFSQTIEAKTKAEAKRKAREMIELAHQEADIDLGWIDPTGDQILIAPPMESVRIKVEN